MNQKPDAYTPQLAGRIAIIAAAAVFAGSIFYDTEGPPWTKPAGVLLLVLSVPFIFWPFLLLTRHGRAEPGAPYYAATHLVDQGIYAIVRHPQYLGYMLLITGFAILTPSPLILAAALIGDITFTIHAIQEEQFCRRRFGAAYDRYAARVPRFNFLLGLIRLRRQPA